MLFAFRELLEARKRDLAACVTAEHGKVLADALGEVTRGIEVVEFACGIPHLLAGGYSEQVSTDTDSYSIRQPLGVVAGITPFNFPVMVPDVDVPARDRVRERVRPEAVRARPVGIDARRRAVARRRPARRCVQRRARRP